MHKLDLNQFEIEQKQLIALVDEDTNAFNSIIKAFSLPKETFAFSISSS